MALFVPPCPLRATSATAVPRCKRTRTSTPTMIAPRTQENSSQTPGPDTPQDGEQNAPTHTAPPGQRPFPTLISDILSIARTIRASFKFDPQVGGMLGSKETVHVLRISSPKVIKFELASGVKTLHEGENMLQFRDEQSAVRTAWIIQDAAAYESVALDDITLAVQQLSSSTGVSQIKTIPERDLNDVDPLHFLPDVVPKDENDINDWMADCHWEDTEKTRFICDMTPGPKENTKLDEEWKETVGKLTLLMVDDTDPECKLCGGSGRTRCSRCGGAAAMALPGSSFECVCYNGEVRCCWCAGDGIPR